ncbi:MAG: disulfide bond formation protein B [Gemmatimonadota bacterium]
MSLYPGIVSALGGLAVVAFLLALGLAFALSASDGRGWLRHALAGREGTPLALGLFVALVATGGSLYLSEIANLTPCELCWYQRIAMYPLVPLWGIALARRDFGAWRYGLPLSLAGLAISAYHVTIQWMPALDVVRCGVGAPCTARYVAVFGFVSIPTMAGAAFVFISMLFSLARLIEKEARMGGVT